MTAQSGKIILRRAHQAEAAALSALALRSKAHWGYNEAFMAACVEELTVTKADITKLDFVVAECDGAVIGFYALAKHSNARCELDALFVEPAYIGQGVGRLLMSNAIAAAQQYGAKILEIQADPNAAPFYQAAGGVIVKQTPSASITGRTLPFLEIDLSR